jgi:predicted RNA methylase
VQTDGNEDLTELRVVDRTNYLFGSRYQATAPEIFYKMLDAHPLPYENCVFIDCGAGKGRVLLMASEFPFKKVIGVEFAADLVEVAEANIRAYRSPTQKCVQFETVCVDATLYPFPPEPTVLFMHNPFEAAAMRAFVARVERSLEEHPRPMYVLYRNPTCAKMWDTSRYFERVVASDLFVDHLCGDLRDGREHVSPLALETLGSGPAHRRDVLHDAGSGIRDWSVQCPRAG